MGRTVQRYPLPVDTNVDFVRELEYVTRKQSFIAKEHPEVLVDFADIIGGDYTITQDNLLYYTPKGTQDKLTMVESSSAVRSLLDLGFYLRHVARKGDLLMVDEPELNLHPENQRRIARLFARLVNLGVKVFITTHSDYIVKELNTLIMLNHDKPHLKRIAEDNGYRQSELIRSDQVKVYMTQEILVPLEEGQKRRRRGLTLVEADVDPVLGIEAPSFDETIDEMNSIQADIVWGAE
jgi:wobble nucleotide-excising tRNase